MIQDAKELSRDRLAEFYRELLQPAFRADELVSLERFLASVLAPDGTGRGIVATDDGGELLGGLFVEWYPRCRVVLGSYVVVRPDRRGQGVGRELLTGALDDLGHRLRPLLVLGEVEDPRRWTDATYGDAVARLRLYASLGARIVDVPYLQPALGDDGSRVLDLLLMAFPPSDVAGRPRLTGEQAEAAACFVEAYFAASEGSLSDDPELGQLLTALRAPEGVPLLDADDVLAEVSDQP